MQQRDHGIAGRSAPHVVHHEVEIGGRGGERASVASRSSVSGRRRVAARLGQRVQPVEVSAGADDPPGAESLGHLDGHRAGVAGRAEHQDRLTGLDRDAAAQRDPRRHRRVHRGGDLDDVGVVGQLDAAARVDDRSSAIVPITSSAATK